MTRIALYAPIKPPDHPIPSGDRLIAQNLVKALEIAGFEVELASRYIAYSKRPIDKILRERKRGALAEAQNIIERHKGLMSEDRPDLFLTYHPYCKAPDWIGPAVSKALNIPYVTLEAARTGQGFENNKDLWRDWRAEAQAGIRAVDLHLVFKPTDRAYLTELLGSDKKLRNIAPFIDVKSLQTREELQVSWPSQWRGDQPAIITVGMMRPGKKVKNFELIAAALDGLQHLPWNLVVIGGGPEEEKIRCFFKDIREDRILWTGAIKSEEVSAHMAKADLFFWPGWREPIGMVYLEAQALGLPVAALDDMGVPLVVSHGETGLLAPAKDMNQLTANVATLLSHPDLRADLGRAAKTKVETEHGLDAAAKTLQRELAPLLSFG